MGKQELLRLNLQHFAEESEDSTEVDETNSSDETENTEEQESVDNRIPYDRFKEKVDEVNALKKRLAKIEEEQEEAKRKELEENEQFKELYEQAIKQVEDIKKEALTIKKNSLLSQAGYSDEQIELLVKLVEGGTDDEIEESIGVLKTTIPPKKEEYADPSPFNGSKSDPKPVGMDEVGSKVFERIKNKIF